MLYGDFAVTPGTIWLATLAVNLLGADKMDPGNFATPVFLKDVNVEDARAFLELAKGLDPKIKLRTMRYSVRASTSCHDQPCVEVMGAPPEVIAILKAAVSENRMYEKAYGMRNIAGAFLQGEDVASGWVLIEFWQENYMPFVDYLNERLKELKLGGG